MTSGKLSNVTYPITFLLVLACIFGWIGFSGDGWTGAQIAQILFAVSVGGAFYVFIRRVGKKFGRE